MAFPDWRIQLMCVYSQLFAEDLDSPANGRITYSILKGDRENQFWIDPIIGLLKVNKALDREMVSPRNEPDSFANES